MQLGLSSAVAPDASLAELIAACRRRGLEVLELREGDAHGIAPGQDVAALADAATQARAAGVRIAAYRVQDTVEEAPLVALALHLETRLLLEPDATGVALRLRAAGADVAVVLSGADVQQQALLLADTALPVAWDVDPALGGAGPCTAALLDAVGGSLVHVCLAGGGPELVEHEGRGLGELMGRLALAGWRGSLAIAPSSMRYRVIWQHWLGRRGGTGCGSKVSDPLAVRLHTA